MVVRLDFSGFERALQHCFCTYDSVYRCGETLATLLLYVWQCVQVWGNADNMTVCTGVGKHWQHCFCMYDSVCRCGDMLVILLLYVWQCVQVWGNAGNTGFVCMTVCTGVGKCWQHWFCMYDSVYRCGETVLPLTHLWENNRVLAEEY